MDTDDSIFHLIDKTFSQSIKLYVGDNERKELIQLRKDTILWLQVWNKSIPELFQSGSINEWDKFSQWFQYANAKLKLYKEGVSWDTEAIREKFNDTYRSSLQCYQNWRKHSPWFRIPIQIKPKNGIYKKQHNKPKSLVDITKPSMVLFLNCLLDLTSSILDYIETERMIDNETEDKIIDPIDRLSDMITLLNPKK